MATKTTTKKSSAAPKNGRPRSTRDIAADVTKLALEHIDAGVPIWHRPWTSAVSAPTSLATGKLYRGINVLLLLLAAQEKGYGSHLWGTYNQLAERAGMVKVTDEETGRERWVSPEGDDQPRGVRKGEKSTQIVFWKILKKDEWDETKSKTVTKKIPLLRVFHVFNADQAEFPDGIKGVKLVERGEEFDPIHEAEELLKEYLSRDGAPTLHHGGGQAFYRPATDEIHLPKFEDFKSAEHYYSTLYHEATHSTGAEKRLKREGIVAGTFGPFGSPVYSNEELIAEMGAAILCAIAGINQAETIPATAAYLKHWRDQLSGDNNLIIRAAAAAQRAVDHILGTTFEDDEDEKKDEKKEEVPA